jgi:hypothetical protein
MPTKMIVDHQKVTKEQRRRRRHARMWKFSSPDERFAHIISDCDICNGIYEK